MKHLIRYKFCWIPVMMALGVSSAQADESADARAQASNFFEAGAQAYDAGQYLVAAEALLKAYELLPDPSLLFSAAQSYRRQYLADPSADSLQHAVKLYRDYLKADPKAKRRDDAMKALEDLAPLAARGAGAPTSGLVEIPYDGGPSSPSHGETPSDTPKPSTNEAKSETRLLLTARPESAQISVDNGPSLPSTSVVKVATGPHSVRVQAPGYYDEQFTMLAVANELMPRHVVLRPKPAKLRVLGTSGARISIDGQIRATTPTETALSVTPGVHFVTVSRTGYQPFGQLIDLSQDQTADLTVNLPPTPQRIIAWTVLGAGAAGAITSGILGGIALSHQASASSLHDKQTTNTLTADERDQYNRAVTSRNDFTLAAAVAGGASALTLITGLGLFVLDEPEVLTPPEGEQSGQPSKPTPRTDFTVGFTSVGLRMRF